MIVHCASSLSIILRNRVTCDVNNWHKGQSSSHLKRIQITETQHDCSQDVPHPEELLLEVWLFHILKSLSPLTFQNLIQPFILHLTDKFSFWFCYTIYTQFLPSNAFDLDIDNTSKSIWLKLWSKRTCINTLTNDSDYIYPPF